MAYRFLLLQLLCMRYSFPKLPRLDKGGVLSGRALFFNIIVDQHGNKEETEERICNKCWVSDLSRFADQMD
jgi:hypothetical protein